MDSLLRSKKMLLLPEYFTISKVEGSTQLNVLIETSPIPTGSASITMYSTFVITDADGKDIILTQEGDESTYYWDDQQHQVLRPTPGMRLRGLAEGSEVMFMETDSPIFRI